MHCLPLSVSRYLSWVSAPAEHGHPQELWAAPEHKWQNALPWEACGWPFEESWLLPGWDPRVLWEVGIAGTVQCWELEIEIPNPTQATRA
jgi:hypothetical protein